MNKKGLSFCSHNAPKPFTIATDPIGLRACLDIFGAVKWKPKVN